VRLSGRVGARRPRRRFLSRLVVQQAARCLWRRVRRAVGLALTPSAAVPVGGPSTASGRRSVRGAPCGRREAVRKRASRGTCAACWPSPHPEGPAVPTARL